MSNGTPRTRREVRSLLADDDGLRVLEQYATAVDRMRELDLPDGDGPPTNPLSWRYQAALHGISPFRDDELWSKCRHNSWFFFPWHRMYLMRFERIVQHHLGDDTWSLPYWDYTDPDDDEAHTLPEPFRHPSGGNPLFLDRNPGINEGEPIDLFLCDARPALRVPDFALPGEDPRPTFGGDVVQDVRPNANGRGSLETTPHGTVHGAVGGAMGFFDTAALDPIFWLHHCNIDRLWQVWLDLGAGHADPAESTWLGTTFEFYDVDGERVGLDIESILDTRALGYVYESTAPPSGTLPLPEPIAVGPVPDGLADDIMEEVPMPAPELVGAAQDVAFAEETTISVPLETRAGPLRAAVGPDAGGEEERWYLRVENVTGENPQASAYGVYLDAGETETPLRVGTIAAFGIPEASRSDETHDGTGVTDAFDITDAVRELDSRSEWDAATARVTIRPVDAHGDPAPGGDVRAGRISFYRG
jgi:tyrosinase